MSRPYHERTRDGLALSADPSDAVKLGLQRAFALPPLLALLAALVGVVVMDDLPGAPGLFATLSIPFGLASFVWGLVGVARAGSLAAESRVVWTGTALRFSDGDEVARSAIAKVIAFQPSKALKWRAIAIVGASGKPVIVLDGLPPGRGPEIAAAADALAAEIGVPVEADDARNATALGLEGPNMAALCYLPVQGICLGVSLLVLVFGKDPFVRFCAKQSLLWFAVSTAAILGVIAVGLTPTLFLPDEAGLVLAIGTGFVAIGIGLARLVVFLFAAWKAWHGVPWLIPGLSGMSAQWLPEAQPAQKPVDAGVWTPPVGS